MAQPETALNQSNTPPTDDYLNFVNWTVTCTRKELLELDDYIQEKIKDLVTKFRLIAENATKSSKAVPGDEASPTISIGGSDYTYAQATKELHKLTDSLLAEAQIKNDRMSLRKKIDQFSLALFKYAEGTDNINTALLPNIKIITDNIKDIIVAFQFQDFVKQRLTHIDVILATLEEKSQALVSSGAISGHVPDEMANELLDKFFLSNVKETFVQGLDPAQAQNLNVTIESEDDDIELF